MQEENVITGYPETATIEIFLIADILKNRQLRERAEEFSFAQWKVDGFVRRMIFGQPDNGPQMIVAGVPERIETDEQGLEALEYLTGKGDATQRALSLPRGWWKSLLAWLFEQGLKSLE